MRARARLAVERLAYEGAKTGRRIGGWEASAAGPNAALTPNLTRLRARSRDLIRDVAVAARAATLWPSKVVGTGMVAQFRCEDPQVLSKIESLWADWSKQAGSDGESLESLQAVMVRAEFEGGECLLRRRFRLPSDGLAVPIQFQALEGDFLDLNRQGPTTGSQYAVGGIEFDGIGRRVGYWLYDRHPGEFMGPGALNSGGYASKLYPADELFHLFERLRPGQVRGVPKLHPVMLRLKDLDDYEDAEVVRKRSEACMVGAVTQREGDGMPLSPAAIDPTSGRRFESMEPGAVYYLREGESMLFNNPAQTNSYESYKRSIARDIAMGLHIPYELLYGDLSQVNYSSYRGGLLSFRERIEEFRYNTFLPVCDWIFKNFLDAARLSGLLPRGVPIDVTWVPPKFDLLDRLEEAKADVMEIRAGLETLPGAIARRGYDVRQHIADIKHSNDELDKNGFTFDTDPRRIAGNGQTQQTQNGGGNGTP